MFRFAEPNYLSQLLAQAGFDHIDEQTTTLEWTWPGPPEEVWEYIQSVSTPFRPLLERVSEEQWSAINREVLAAIGKYFDGHSVKFGVTVVLASGQKA
jgi:hypothetical protein